MTRCPRPGCGGTVVLDRDDAVLRCMSCARTWPVEAQQPPAEHRGTGSTPRMDMRGRW